jgi:hypothetical protein
MNLPNPKPASEGTGWQIHFCTSWDDEPADTVIDVTEQAGADVIMATSGEGAVGKFLSLVDSSRRKFYDEEGSLWAVPDV